MMNAMKQPTDITAKQRIQSEANQSSCWPLSRMIWRVPSQMARNVEFSFRLERRGPGCVAIGVPFREGHCERFLKHEVGTAKSSLPRRQPCGIAISMKDRPLG